MENITVYKNAKLRHQNDLVDIVVADGCFKRIGVNAGDQFPDAPVKDLKGKLTCEPFVESHIHLDYVYTADLQNKATESGTLFEAIDNWSESKHTLSIKGIKERAKKAISCQIQNGVQYVRTHVDVCDPNLTALKAILELKEELKDIIYIQTIAFPQEGYYAYPNGDQLVEEALKMGADVVGGIPHFEFTREQGLQSIEKGFALAQKYDRLLDFHCDETDDEQSRFSEKIAAEAYFSGLKSRATASHTCAMGSYSNAYDFKMMTKYKQAEINFISCPTENTYLQGRYDAYPKRRGLTRIDELIKNGINVSLGQDSISDPWYPLGSGDMIHQLDFALHQSHRMSLPEIETSLDLITTNGAKTLSLPDTYSMKEGNPASFIVINDVSEFEAIRNEASVILSVRNGQILMEKQPETILTMPEF